jgi:phage shock protein C
MSALKLLLEKQLFGVCTSMGQYFKISTSRIRMYFIYASFLTFGSPLLIYLFMAFWMNINSYIKERRRSIWEL